MTDMQVMDKMAAANQDIRMTGTIVEVRSVKKGGYVTFGVDPNTYDVISRQLATGENTHYVAMYVINKEQFEAIKKAEKK